MVRICSGIYQLYPLPISLQYNIIVDTDFLEKNMEEDMDYVIKNIDFSMKMEAMPLTEEDKSRLKICLNGGRDINDILQETIKKHTKIAV